MTRAARRLEQLECIRALRALGKQIAENEVLEAKRLLRRACEERDREIRQLEAAVADWHRELAAPDFDPVAIARRGAVIDRQFKRAEEYGGRVEARQSDLTAARNACNLAIVEESCASSLLHREKVRVQRQREERQVAESGDESAIRALMS